MQNNFNKRTVSIDPLTVKPHPFLALFNDIPTEYFVSTWVRFMSLRTVIIDTTGRLIAGIEDVIAAQKNSLSQIDAIQVDMSEEDLVRFINLNQKTARKDYGTKYLVISFLEHFFSGPEGKVLFDSIPGDIDETIATLLDCSSSSVQNIKFMGTHDPDVFEKIAKGEVLYSEALQIIRDGNEEKGIKPRGGRNPKVTQTERSEFPVGSISISVPRIGDFLMTYSNGSSIATFNSQNISGFYYYDFDEIDSFSNEIGATRYVFQSADQKSSIHLIVNNPKNLFK
ncbi:hypothetical protein [Flavisolibacter ginsengisoli]|jgi:hypothetical protein|uniref:Uncharacterized protein n=1 Tax=Flavisolibacter ginsengisoli DSM 18119 TaxID=1121884 RepID=A0A1M5CGT7_9BACT|nr:hypothetical protein [Flavisolibacter ginsengisoli]SHF53817.1 hypothetical protein SAMN02745131_02931 [Flavisolibacter ginsengisoli DSM 18119]